MSGSSSARSNRQPRVDVIFNPVSGTGDPKIARQQIERELSNGYQVVNIHETQPDEQHTASALAHHALQDGASTIVASGGDGTVTAVAQAIHEFVIQKQDDTEHKQNIQPSTNEPDVTLQQPQSVQNENVTTPEQDANQQVTNTNNSDCEISDTERDIIRNKQSTRVIPSLGVIPRGTANALCVALGIPTRNLTKAAKLINRGHTRPVDMALVNGNQAMMLICGIGLEANVIQHARRGLKRALGAFAYVIAGFRGMELQKTFTVQATLHDVQNSPHYFSGAKVSSDCIQLHSIQVKAVTIANAAPSTSVLAHGLGDVCVDDGLLEFVCLAPGRERGSLFRAMIAMLNSALLRRPLVRRDIFGLRAKKIEIDCNPPQSVVIDGEEAGTTPVMVEIADTKQSRVQIHVIAPKASEINRRRRRFSRALARTYRNTKGLILLAAAVCVLRKRKSMSEDGPIQGLD